MKSSIHFHVGSALGGVGATVLATVAVAMVYRVVKIHNTRKTRKQILEKLPQNLSSWRIPQDYAVDENGIWELLTPLLRDEGVTLFDLCFSTVTKAPESSWPSSNGYQHVLPVRDLITSDVAGSARELRVFSSNNPLKRAARTREGQDVVLRVIAVHNEGRDHLAILWKIATSPNSLQTNNHTLPMLFDLQFDYLTIGIFPKVGSTMSLAVGQLIWARNSVGDILDMVTQALEALEYIHSLLIVHRDAFSDNFLVEWQPESMRVGTIATSRPRIFLIDFETAHAFDSDCSRENAVLTGLPCGGSVQSTQRYTRPTVPEMKAGTAYDPFKVDVWQLGASISDFKTTFHEIDAVLEDMCSIDPRGRLDASVALSRLRTLIQAIPPRDLHILPNILDVEYVPI